jgi:hypothetical protein
MDLQLSARDRAMLEGEHGPAAKMAMSILVRMAGVYGAAELMDITQAHIDSTIYVGDAGLEFAERLATLGAKVSVPTTLNVSGVDEHHWREWAVPPDWAEKAHRQMIAYQNMGTTPTWTCAPYQTDLKPRFGQQIAWGESNAIAFANSVIGARTERYPDLLDICAAITGRVPAVGLHLTENRGSSLKIESPSWKDSPSHRRKTNSKACVPRPLLRGRWRSSTSWALRLKLARGKPPSKDELLNANSTSLWNAYAQRDGSSPPPKVRSSTWSSWAAPIFPWPSSKRWRLCSKVRDVTLMWSSW